LDNSILFNCDSAHVANICAPLRQIIGFQYAITTTAVGRVSAAAIGAYDVRGPRDAARETAFVREDRDPSAYRFALAGAQDGLAAELSPTRPWGEA
jgi:hypothetical protein